MIANGNMLTHNSPSADYTYTYNARNRRTQVLLGGNATTDVINGLGQRTVQTWCRRSSSSMTKRAI